MESMSHGVLSRPKFPPSRLVDAFDQVVEPLITEITCLRSHELRLFHLVSVYIDSPPGNYGLMGVVGLAGLAGAAPWTAGPVPRPLASLTRRKQEREYLLSTGGGSRIASVVTSRRS
jgi:hypothetical protein